MENIVKEIKKSMIKSIMDTINNKEHTFVVEINVHSIQSWKGYISEIQREFNFPTSCYDSVDRYLDWMRDLSWLEKESYIIIINNFKQFLKKDLKLKREIISDFEEIILPYWERKSKLFLVYLVQ